MTHQEAVNAKSALSFTSYNHDGHVYKVVVIPSDLKEAKNLMMALGEGATYSDDLAKSFCTNSNFRLGSYNFLGFDIFHDRLTIDGKPERNSN